MDAEIQKLLDMGAISVGENEEGYFSNLFTKQKSDGSYRWILNLKSLHNIRNNQNSAVRRPLPCNRSSFFSFRDGSTVDSFLSFYFSSWNDYTRLVNSLLPMNYLHKWIYRDKPHQRPFISFYLTGCLHRFTLNRFNENPTSPKLKLP